MAHTNKTTNYELPQYVGSDIINPLVDTNDAYQTIDTQMKANADAAAEAASAASGVGDRATTLEGKVEALETQNGSEVLTTTAQTLSGAVNEIDGELNTPTTGIVARVVAAGTDITNLKNQCGNTPLDTTAQTLSGAINELLAMIQAL